MVLRTCVLLGLLLTVASAQSGGDMMMGINNSLAANFDSAQAVEARARHFYCLDFNMTAADFEGDLPSADNTNTARLWAIFLQYPILSYLDSYRKELLFRTIAGVVQLGGLTNFNESEFCVAQVTHYRVSSYEESVLINFYFNDSMVVNEDGGTISIEEFNMAFNTGFNSPEARSMNLVRDFLGRPALVVDIGDLTSTEDNVIPRPSDSFFNMDVDQDPTLRAVFLGSYIGSTNISVARSNQQAPFAENPNPINFGLEPGDIVFAVFGAIFLTILAFMIVLGYCIHPFFLS